MIKILSCLSTTCLEKEAQSSAFPKWATSCAFKLLNMPTLDAAYLAPGAPNKDIVETVSAFSELLRVRNLLVRSDGGTEIKNYPRGGATLPLARVVEVSSQLLQTGRAVILKEPTNRFDNKLTINLMLNPTDLICEILGPGYDLGDLNRGGILPQYIIRLPIATWHRHEEIRLSDVNVTQLRDQDELRRQSRLLNIGLNILPSMFMEVTDPPAEFAERWLRDQSNDALWKPWQLRMRLPQIRRWYDDAFSIADYFSKRGTWKCLVLGGSTLPDGRFIYWDVVNGSDKWGMAS